MRAGSFRGLSFDTCLRVFELFLKRFHSFFQVLHVLLYVLYIFLCCQGFQVGLDRCFYGAEAGIKQLPGLFDE